VTQRQKIPFDGKMKKTELYEIIKLKKPEPVYKTDEFLRGKGHDVLRLPPYHCEFNPIEMVKLPENIVYSDQYISVVSPSLS
jgi:hypothetical protein